MDALLADLQGEFHNQKVPAPDPQVLRECAQLAQRLGVSAKRVAAEWEAASLSGALGPRLGLTLLREHLPVLQQRLDAQPKASKPSPQARPPVQGLDLSLFGLPSPKPEPKAKPDPAPDAMDLEPSPLKVETPGSSSKYAQRKDAGKVLSLPAILSRPTFPILSCCASFQFSGIFTTKTKTLDQSESAPPQPRRESKK